MINEDWIEFDISDRRYITVVDDSQLVERSPDAVAPQDPGQILLKAFGDLPWPAKVAAVAAMFPVAGWVAAGAVATMLGAARKASEDARILKVPRSKLDMIDFGAQGWMPKVVYAVNPVDPLSYRALATFHEEIFLHRIAELERLLNALGARHYKIEHSSAKQRSGGGGIGGGLLFLGAGLGASAQSKLLRSRTWQGTTEPRGRPKLPTGLRWYPNEPDWQGLAESRLRGGRKEFKITISQYEDFGVDAGLVASVKAVNLELGGRYVSCDHIEFSVTGSF